MDEQPYSSVWALPAVLTGCRFGVRHGNDPATDEANCFSLSH